MSTTYTPTPNALPATLELPQDAVEDLVVETVNTNTAILADAILQNADDIDSTQTDLDTAEVIIERIRLARAYQAEVLGTTVAVGDYLEINNSDVNVGGFATFSIGGGGTELRPPVLSNMGVYRVNIDLIATTADASTSAPIVVEITLYNSVGPTETVIATALNRRWSATTGITIPVNKSCLIDFTGLTATSRIRLKNASADTITLNSTSRISVNRVGDGT